MLQVAHQNLILINTLGAFCVAGILGNMGFLNGPLERTRKPSNYLLEIHERGICPSTE
jgi:hypothetical protein